MIWNIDYIEILLAKYWNLTLSAKGAGDEEPQAKIAIKFCAALLKNCATTILEILL